ncbi:MAG TPA: glycosyltransferase family 2 protein [Leptolyngbyaceae cyanobacterium M33_DOE_097]|uniref:4,4'-diaponeurosporenoate glycosyltransferase n=1 Tax=Oscillatoriales cyanobacterium SpSt-418 TaxID=2282169 RepID=A0A7C3PNB3_9CYAN|nr:glycosyltransferase family 2 protein [Leptolyngbyaceae cyanobacterium M33_DOE_097]
MMLSIVIPVHNGGESFYKCLQSLECYGSLASEVIIVVDGGTDNSLALARTTAAKVIALPEAGGPARARNIGASAASGDILFFMDADVTLKPDTLKQIIEAFQAKPEIDALIGSYDDAPGAENFLSQYKNLFHHYTHQTGCEDASTFWGACGAVRRDIFLKVDGFNEAYRYPSIEDIEFGYRLKRAGHRILLCKAVQVKHLKRWEPFSLLRAEIFYRAIPWTELLWRDRQFVNDLNLKTSSRVSLILTFSILVLLLLSFWWNSSLIGVPILATVLFVINLSVYQFFYFKKGLWFAIKTIFWHWLYFLYGGVAFAIGTIRYHLGYQSASTPVSLP